MSWCIVITKRADKFLKVNKNRFTHDEATKLVRDVIEKLQGQEKTIDIKKLKGIWNGFYRVRKGKLRMIIEINFSEQEVSIEVLDWRGNVYR